MNQYDTPLNSFDLRNVATQTKESFEPIPAGQYLAMCIQSEIRTSKNGTDYLFVKLVLSVPEYQNRTLASFFFLWNDDNAKALANFKALRDACGLDSNYGGDASDFLGRYVVLYVDVRDNKKYGGQENYIKFYSKAQRQQPPAAPVQPVQPMPNFVQPQQTAPVQPAQPAQPSEAAINEVPF